MVKRFSLYVYVFNLPVSAELDADPNSAAASSVGVGTESNQALRMPAKDSQTFHRHHIPQSSAISVQRAIKVCLFLADK